MRKNPTMHIYKKGDGYQGSIIVDKKRKFFSGKTKKEVQDKLDEYDQRSRNHTLILDNTRFSVALEAYLKSRPEKIKATTYDRYESTFEHHIKNSKLGRLQVGTIEPDDINELLIEKCNDGLGISSVKKIKSLINLFFEYYTSRNHLLYNPALYAELPSANSFQRQPKEVESFTAEEVLKIISVAEAPSTFGPYYRYGEVIVLMLLTGIRASEARALNIHDFSNDLTRMTVRRTRAYIKKRENGVAVGGIENVMNTPKTKKSGREIELVPRATLAVQRMIERTYNPDTGDLVCSVNGSIIDHKGLQGCFDSILKKADLPHKGLHITRHTFATLSLESEAEIKDISNTLGHSTVSTTYDLYVANSRKRKRQAMNKFNEGLFGSTTNQSSTE